MRGNKTLFITGGAGFLGWNLVPVLAAEYKDIHALRHTSPLPDPPEIQPIDGDLSNPAEIGEIVSDLNPDIIIHAGAVSRSSTCENNPDLAERVNVESANAMLEACNAERTRFIFLSTDLVFDGLKGDYSEENTPNPRMKYGQTKREAESLIIQKSRNFVILRVSLMFGPPSPSSSSFIEWLDKGLSTGVTLFTDEYRTPLYVSDAVKAIRFLCQNRFTGILHLGGSEKCSRYEFGVEFASRNGYENPCINAVTLEKAKLKIYRPPDVSLNSSKAREILGFRTMSWKQGIEEYLKSKDA